MLRCKLPATQCAKLFYMPFLISILEEYLGSTEVQGSCRVATAILVSCCPSSPFIAGKEAIAEYAIDWNHTLRIYSFISSSGSTKSSSSSSSSALAQAQSSFFPSSSSGVASEREPTATSLSPYTYSSYIVDERGNAVGGKGCWIDPTANTPSWCVRNVKFSKNKDGREVLFFTEVSGCFQCPFSRLILPFKLVFLSARAARPHHRRRYHRAARHSSHSAQHEGDDIACAGMRAIHRQL